MGRRAGRGCPADGLAGTGSPGGAPLGLTARFAALLLAGLPLAAAGAEVWSWTLPPGFPAPVVPADNPMSPDKVSLGRRLFFEPRLAEDGRLSCAACHDPRRAYSDPRSTPRGARGDALLHNVPSLANAVYRPAYGWSPGGAASLEQQMLTPLLGEHPVEMGLAGREPQVLGMLAADPGYREGFARAFPDADQPVTLQNLIRAIASFERTLVSGRSAFDRYVFDDDARAMSAAAKRGMKLFYSARARCGQCHEGIDFSGEVRSQGQESARARYVDTGVDGHGPYRVPSLRNVALTAPYMHDGSYATLAQVVDFYDRGGRQRRLRPLGLGAGEKQDLLAFLTSLTDPQFVTGDPP